MPLTQAGQSQIATADFNGDGKPDIVVAGVVLLGNGDGTFSPPTAYSSGSVFCVTVADFNGDGNLDIATPGTLSGSVSVFLGKGDGTFQSALRSVGSAGSVLAVAGLNADGIPDLITGGQNGP